MTQAEAVDWFRVIWDLIYRGINVSKIAERTGIPEAALRGYMSGSQPRHWKGEALLAAWVEVTGRPRDQAPKVNAPMAQHRPQRRKV